VLRAARPERQRQDHSAARHCGADRSGSRAHRAVRPRRHPPLHIEILYNEYNFVGAFAVASLLTLLAGVTLLVKTLVERTGYRRR